jgi:uncharacterized membrane protein
MYALALVRNPALRLGTYGSNAASSPAELSATHASSGGSAVLTVAVLILFLVIVVLGVLVRGMLAAVAEIMGQVVRLFGMLLIALLVMIVLLASLLSGPATGSSPSPKPTPTPLPARIRTP